MLIQSQRRNRAYKVTDPIERFWRFVDKNDPNGCWLWTGTINRTTGYGGFRFGSHILSTMRTMNAHRFAYEYLIGPVPITLTLDHLCRNHLCVNPYHLEPVAHRVNLMRGVGPSALNAQKTHCPAGHAYDLLNTYFDKQGSRHCRICKEAALKRFHAAHPDYTKTHRPQVPHA